MAHKLIRRRLIGIQTLLQEDIMTKMKPIYIYLKLEFIVPCPSLLLTLPSIHFGPLHVFHHTLLSIHLEPLPVFHHTLQENKVLRGTMNKIRCTFTCFPSRLSSTPYQLTSTLTLLYFSSLSTCPAAWLANLVFRSDYWG